MGDARLHYTPRLRHPLEAKAALLPSAPPLISPDRQIRSAIVATPPSEGSPVGWNRSSPSSISSRSSLRRLLFLVEPLFAKLVLPRLGGAPAVWNTCMVFFQTSAAWRRYSDAATTFLRVQDASADPPLAAFAPVRLPSACDSRGLGAPGSTAVPSGRSWASRSWPLGFRSSRFHYRAVLQRWFATLEHGPARDPYFLYAASNAGSIGALVAYPFIIDPSFRSRTGSNLVCLATQSWPS